MSLENKIENLTTAVNNLIVVLHAGAPAATPAPTQVAGQGTVTPAPAAAPVPQPAVNTAAPTPTPQPVASAPQPAGAPAPAAAPAPFSTAQEMTNYVMASYNEMGAEKGARIQEILTGLGVANINDMPADKYNDLYAAVEQLKVS